LIGGTGENYIWTKRRWRLLAEQLVENSRRAGYGLLIATSRRTTRAGERELQKILIPSGQVLAADWYYNRPAAPPPLMAFMGAASQILVTADSVSMTYEAIASGRPVLSIRPHDCQISDQLRIILGRQKQAG